MEKSSNMKSIEFYKLAKYQSKLFNLDDQNDNKATFYKTKINEHATNLSNYMPRDQINQLFQLGAGYYSDKITKQSQEVLKKIKDLEATKGKGDKLAEQVKTISDASNNAQTNHGELFKSYNEDIEVTTNEINQISEKLNKMTKIVDQKIPDDDMNKIQGNLSKVKSLKQMFEDLSKNTNTPNASAASP
jgi:methyl-accepting chemotaxis protein